MKKTVRKTSVAAYTGRAASRVPTVKHEHHIHFLSKNTKRKGNRQRLGCTQCPHLEPWEKATVSLIEALKVPDTSANWTVNHEGFTPDELVGMEGVGWLAVRNGEPVEQYSVRKDAQENKDYGSVAKNEAIERMKFALGGMTKPELLKEYPDYGMFKSWTKDRMIETIVAKEMGE